MTVFWCSCCMIAASKCYHDNKALSLKYGWNRGCVWHVQPRSYLPPAGPAEARGASKPADSACRRKEPCHSWAGRSAALGSQTHPWCTTQEPSPLQTGHTPNAQTHVSEALPSKYELKDRKFSSGEAGKSFQSCQTYPLVKAIGLVVLPHALHHQLHCADVRDLPMEAHLHKGCHSRQKAWYLLQLVPSLVYTVCPRVIHQENAAGPTTTQAFLNHGARLLFS